MEEVQVFKNEEDNRLLSEIMRELIALQNEVNELRKEVYAQGDILFKLRNAFYE